DAAGETPVQKPASENEQALKNVLDKMMNQDKEDSEQSDVVRKEFEAQCNRELLQGKASKASNDPLMPDLEDTAEVQNTSIFGCAYDDDDLDTYNSPFADQVMDAEDNFNNMKPSTIVSYIPTTRAHSIHPKDQIIKKQKRTNHKDFQNYLFPCFISHQEPTKIAQALDDESWFEAMQEELLQFKIQKV
ncbi:hypothetical protein Tco_0193035, partial [Tanacetum coccineum]